MRFGGLGIIEWIIISILCCGGPVILFGLIVGLVIVLTKRSNSKQRFED